MSIALIGNFMDAEPPLMQQEGLRGAIAWLKREYGDIPILGHREAALAGDGTACPGDSLMDILDSFRV